MSIFNIPRAKFQFIPKLVPHREIRWCIPFFDSIKTICVGLSAEQSFNQGPDKFHSPFTFAPFIRRYY